MKRYCKRAEAALLFVLTLAAALPFAAGCGADTARADEGFTDWQGVEFSEETLTREDRDRAIDMELRTEEETRAGTLEEYEQRLAVLREEEERLISKLADVRDIEALPELPEELRAGYIALAAETEAELAALRDDIDRLTEDAARTEALGGPPPGFFDEPGEGPAP